MRIHGLFCTLNGSNITRISQSSFPTRVKNRRTMSVEQQSTRDTALPTYAGVAEYFASFSPHSEAPDSRLCECAVWPRCWLLDRLDPAGDVEPVGRNPAQPFGMTYALA